MYNEHMSIYREAVGVEINRYLTSLMTARETAASAIHRSYETLWSHIAAVSSDGKRIRPYLTVLTYGTLDEKIIPVAAAQELIHIAMLMHDDVMDQDFVRHGKPNISGLYRSKYETYQRLSANQTAHYAHSITILAGDLLIAEAFRSIENAAFTASIRQQVAQQLSQSLFEVVGGQFMDVQSSFVTDDSFSPLDIYRFKTASYSFIRPLITGGICAGWKQPTLDILQEFGTHLGVAFQIQDDLLGVFGDETKTGKSSLTDLREGKNTLLRTIHEKHATTEQKKRLVCLGTETATNEELLAVKHDMVASGAKQETLRLSNEYADKALASLDSLPHRDVAAALTELVEKLRGRDV